jgi:transposase
MLTGANTPDLIVFEELANAVEPIKRPGGGRLRRRPEKLHADKAYDSERCRGALSKRGIKVKIARKGKESSQKLDTTGGWVVERTLAWLARCRRLAVRYERQADMHEAFSTSGFPHLPQLLGERGILAVRASKRISKSYRDTKCVSGG